jgi:hypothetical protein
MQVVQIRWKQTDGYSIDEDEETQQVVGNSELSEYIIQTEDETQNSDDSPSQI